MHTATATAGESPEDRIGRALARIEQAADAMAQRQARVESAARQSLQDIEHLIDRAAAHG